MRKRIIYLGLLFILFSAVVLAISAFNIQNMGSSNIYNITNPTIKNVTVKGAGFISIPIRLNGTSTLAFAATLYNRSNLYLMNNSAFLSWSSSNSVNGLAKALALEGGGIIAIYRNVSSAIFPTSTLPGLNNATSAPDYEISSAINGTLSGGDYYILIDNTNGSASYAHEVPANIQYLAYSQSTSLSILKDSSSLSSFLLTSSISVLFFVVGFALVIAGLVMKSKDKQGLGVDVSDEQLNELYKGVVKRPVRKSSRKTRKR